MPIHVLTPQAIEQQLAIAEQLCKQRQKRFTPIRKHVLELLIKAQRGLKAYELLDLVKQEQPNAAPPTVYRALDFLTEEGLIHRLDAINAWTACVDVAGEPHDLLVVCTQCGTVAELRAPRLSQQITDCIVQAGFALSSPETELRALCLNCSKAPPSV
ncbi:MAG TPA: transcriptional repressor [Paenalcaligenes hominis]|uniref:Ferric uptake regulation protein n=1 Tax=Paenalcaligenes hominis TaxID=643674 RepID=A0A9D3AAK6_9BURK|nr:transcriptional repressor [Paenalcaligenes hominis]